MLFITLSVGTDLSSAEMDKSKDWQLELLMEKLRSKASQFKTFPEISKNIRMTMLVGYVLSLECFAGNLWRFPVLISLLLQDKRYSLDSVEKSQHQKCLDTLQHSIKVTCLQNMIERLESLTRQLG